MDSVRTRIEEIQHEIDQAWSDLRSEAMTLASLSCASGDETLSLIAPSMRASFSKNRDSSRRLEISLKERDELKKKLSEGQANVSRLQKEKSQNEKNMRLLASRIGAVAYAQAGAADCSPAVKEALKPFLEKEEQMRTQAGRKFIAGLAGRMRLSFYQSRQDDVFMSCFSVLDEKGLLEELSGENAQNLVSSYSAFRSAQKMLEHDIEAKKHRLSTSQLTLEQDDGLDEKYKAAKNEMTESGVNYGFYLFDNGSKWIGPSTPESFLDVVSRMLALHQKIDACTKEIEKENELAAIADFTSMIEFNNGRIQDLKGEINRIKGQIEAIEEENRALRRKISNVEARIR